MNSTPKQTELPLTASELIQESYKVANLVPTALEQNIQANYQASTARYYIEEIVSKYFNSYSWQLETCFHQYITTYSLPESVKFTVLAFCKLLDHSHNLTPSSIVGFLGKAQVSSYQYSSITRKLVEQKKIAINTELRENISYYFCYSHTDLENLLTNAASSKETNT